MPGKKSAQDDQNNVLQDDFLDAPVEGDEDWMAEAEGQLAVDVYQTKENVVIKAPIAGVTPDKIDIEVAEDVVTIRGERVEEKRSRPRALLRAGVLLGRLLPLSHFADLDHCRESRRLPQGRRPHPHHPQGRPRQGQEDQGQTDLGTSIYFAQKSGPPGPFLINKIAPTYTMCYTSYMDRVNIYLPTQLRQRLKLHAERVGRPQAEIIRELLEQGLEAQPARANEDLLALAHLGIKGPTDLSTKLDEYLYGDQ